MKKKLLNFIDHEHTEKVFVFLILFEVVVCMLDADSSKYASAFKHFVNYFEFFVMSLFTIEYLIRVFTAEKMKHIFRPMMVVDLFTLIPVTGLIFLLAIVFSSLFVCIAENSSVPMVFKNLPPSSLWSIVTYIIFCCANPIPLATVNLFICTITPSLSLFAQVLLFGIIAFVIFDLAQKLYRSFNVRKLTLRVEPG